MRHALSWIVIRHGGKGRLRRCLRCNEYIPWWLWWWPWGCPGGQIHAQRS